MSLAVPELVMLGASTASASCCLAPAARASGPARGLAVAMVTVMLAVTLVPVAAVQQAGAAVLVAWSVVLLLRSGPGPGRAVDLHRAGGAVLMAAAVVTHAVVPDGSGTASMAGLDHTGMHHSAAGGWDGASVLLQAAVAGYLVWTAVAAWRMRHRPRTDLLRWEHLAMAAGVAVMVWGMG